MHLILIERETIKGELAKKITSQFNGYASEIAPDVWAVGLPKGRDMTARQLSEQIGLTGTPPHYNSATVFTVSDYWGLATPELWQILKQRWEGARFSASPADGPA